MVFWEGLLSTKYRPCNSDKSGLLILSFFYKGGLLVGKVFSREALSQKCFQAPHSHLE